MAGCHWSLLLAWHGQCLCAQVHVGQNASELGCSSLDASVFCQRNNKDVMILSLSQVASLYSLFSQFVTASVHVLQFTIQ